MYRVGMETRQQRQGELKPEKVIISKKVKIINYSD